MADADRNTSLDDFTENRKERLYCLKLQSQKRSAGKLQNKYYVAQNKERTLNAKKLLSKVSPCEKPLGNEFYIKPGGVNDAADLGRDIAELMAYRDALKKEGASDKAEELRVIEDFLNAWFYSMKISPEPDENGTEITPEMQKDAIKNLGKVIEDYRVFVRDRDYELSQSEFSEEARAKWKKEQERYMSALDPDVPLNEQMDILYKNVDLTEEERTCGSILNAFISERRRSKWYRDLVALEEKYELPDEPGKKEIIRAFMPIFKITSEKLTDDIITSLIENFNVIFDPEEKDEGRLLDAYHKVHPMLQESVDELTDFRIANPGVFDELSPIGLFYQVKELFGCYDKARGMRDICNRIVYSNALFVMPEDEREDFLQIYIESSALYDTLITSYEHMHRADTSLPGHPPATPRYIMEKNPDYTSTSFDYAKIDAEVDCRESVQRRISSCTGQ